CILFAVQLNVTRENDGMPGFSLPRTKPRCTCPLRCQETLDAT
ncbi:hypothetical protein X777_10153, partial [Ooceraea biroi]